MHVIVPAYNETPMLRSVVEAILAKGYTVVVVDDGSLIDQSACLTDLTVHFLKHEINLGQGAALQTGTAFALLNKANFIVHFDADGQHSAEDISALLTPLFQKKAEIVFGSRFLSKPLAIPKRRVRLLRLARYINFFFTGILLTDAHNGLRALTATSAKKICITENRMAHASEILFLVKKHNLSFTEVPVHISYTDYSKQKGQSAWNSIRIFFDLLLHKLFE
ncbi:glycosyltransferase family 2 protein [Lacibacter luteus]|uniref:Glycosyltransferase family 2 protein n=1 Tax=Lacibacter luteus TaxID=2508719 RepID=A0A4Q1CJY7_9BACT|nr:glycosyltransferase family 2 protein [Lacibacter luteus]RXK60697.1 glycosyltransferase family 2 protein [Lacibacter luteus]